VAEPLLELVNPEKGVHPLLETVTRELVKKQKIEKIQCEL
jgi:hypothetical protein